MRAGGRWRGSLGGRRLPLGARMPGRMPRVDVLIVSLGGTAGLREADLELAGLAAPRGRGGRDRPRGACARAAHLRRDRVQLGRQRAPRGAECSARGDAAGGHLFDHHRRAPRSGFRRDPLRRARRGQPPGPPRPLAATRRSAPLQGRAAARAVERGRLGGGAQSARRRGDRADAGRALGRAGRRDIAAITYAANPAKKGLDTRVGGVARRIPRGRGAPRRGPRRAARARNGSRAPMRPSRDLPKPPGERGTVRFAGLVPRDQYRALLRRARVFVTAPRREDYGIAQLEALADGCVLVTTAPPGPYVAAPIARRIDNRLVGPRLALRAALDVPRADYAERAAAALGPFSPAAVDRVVAESCYRGCSLRKASIEGGGSGVASGPLLAPLARSVRGGARDAPGLPVIGFREPQVVLDGGCVVLVTCGVTRTTHPHRRATSTARACSRRAALDEVSTKPITLQPTPVTVGLPARRVSC